MSGWKLMLGALVLTVSFQGGARAQVSVDVAKITCDQFLLFKVADPRDISIWLSGYYGGKRDNTVIDTQKFKDYSDKLRMYCRSNLTMPIMEAAQKVLELKE
jgi:acid stress chaperone HdeB